MASLKANIGLTVPKLTDIRYVPRTMWEMMGKISPPVPRPKPRNVPVVKIPIGSLVTLNPRLLWTC